MRTKTGNPKSSLASTAARVCGATHWLVLVLTLLLSPLTGRAQSPLEPPVTFRTDSGLSYTTNSGVVTIVGFPDTATTVMIPNMIDGLPVTGIEPPRFIKRGPNLLLPYQGPTNIVIPSSVIRIDTAVFSSLQDLVAITVDAANPAYCSPDGVLYDKSQAQILRCPPGRVGDCVIARGVRIIAAGAFSECRELQHVVIPEGVEEIGPSSFSECDGLTDLRLPASLRKIGDGAFYHCWSLTELAIPDRVNLIGSKAFSSCGNLSRTQLPAGILTIETGTFANCWALTAIAIPTTVTRIAERAFQGCERLAEIEIPASVTAIEDGAFSGCNGLTTLRIPASVTSIAAGAFVTCNNLTALTVDPLNPRYSSVDGVLFDKKQSLLIQCPARLSGVLNVPGTVTHIGAAAFVGCSQITSVNLPEGVMEIGDGAFVNCHSLNHVTLPASLLRIGNDAFRYCSDLADLVIPERATCNLGDMLSNCEALRSVTLSAGVTNIPGGAFAGCARLRSITVSSQNPAYSSREGVLFDKIFTSLLHCPKGMAGDFAVPQGVRDIPPNAFRGCANLTTISLPGSLTNIGGGAFSGCTSLTGVAIPSTALQIGDSAFAECTSLATLSISQGVRQLGCLAFAGCTSLTMVSIPASVTRIAEASAPGILYPMLIRPLFAGDSSTFADCSSLREINVDPSNSSYFSQDGVLFAFGGPNAQESPDPVDLQSFSPRLLRYPCAKAGAYSLPTNTARIAPAAFYNCTALTRVTVPERVYSVGTEAFSGCTKLTAVSLPDGLNQIPDAAFLGCRSLTNIAIPSGVTAIGGFAFDGCHQLAAVTFPETVTTIGESAFAGCTSLRTVWLPASVTNISSLALSPSSALYAYSIGSDSSSITSRLESIDVDPGNAFYSSQDGVLFNQDGTALLQYPHGRSGPYAVPATVVRIGYGAFSDSATLTSVALPPRLTSLPDVAFAGCRQLADISLPDTLTSLGTGDFAGCSALSRIVVPPLVTAIPQSTFADCTSLTEVVLPVGLKSIEEGVFWGCSGLRRIVIPQSVEAIGSQGRTFYCTNLLEFTVSPLNASYSSLNGVLFNKDCTRLIQVPQAKSGEYRIPDGVVSVDPGCFGSNPWLTRISIPASTTSLSDWAFSDCAGLDVIEVDPANQVYCSLNGVLFDKRCAGLVQYPRARTGSYAVPEGITRFGYAFSGCVGLSHLRIPASVTAIIDGGLGGCPSLAAIEVDPSNPAYAAVDGILFDKSLTHLLRSSVTLSGGYSIPTTVTHIDAEAFDYCAGLTALTVPAGVAKIESGRGVWGCTNLQAIYFQGDEPAFDAWWADLNAGGTSVAYYRPGTLGWRSTFAGMPTAPWELTIANHDQNLGVSEGGFAFNFTSAPGLAVIVEACTDLAHPTWIPVATNTLTAGNGTFQDPEWTQHAGQFYRLRTE